MATGEFGEKTFTTFEVARLCGVFHTTVINWVNKGKLKARVTPGGHRRIPVSELVPFMRRYEMPIPAGMSEPHKKIVVLDGARATSKALEKGLGRKGRYSVQAAADPVDALVAIGKSLPELLVIDLGTPSMDGFRVCRSLKANPATKDMKIVVVSGKRLSAERRALLAEICDGLLVEAGAGEIVGAVGKLLN